MSLLVFLGLESTVGSISRKSAKIVDVFNKTITDLNNVNAKADTHISKRQSKIDKFKAEQDAISATKANNQKVIDKISKIFE